MGDVVWDQRGGLGGEPVLSLEPHMDFLGMYCNGIYHQINLISSRVLRCDIPYTLEKHLSMGETMIRMTSGMGTAFSNRPVCTGP